MASESIVAFLPDSRVPFDSADTAHSWSRNWDCRLAQRKDAKMNHFPIHAEMTADQGIQGIGKSFIFPPQPTNRSSYPPTAS